MWCMLEVLMKIQKKLLSTKTAIMAMKMVMTLVIIMTTMMMMSLTEINLILMTIEKKVEPLRKVMMTVLMMSKQGI